MRQSRDPNGSVPALVPLIQLECQGQRVAQRRGLPCCPYSAPSPSKDMGTMIMGKSEAGLVAVGDVLQVGQGPLAAWEQGLGHFPASRLRHTCASDHGAAQQSGPIGALQQAGPNPSWVLPLRLTTPLLGDAQQAARQGGSGLPRRAGVLCGKGGCRGRETIQPGLGELLPCRKANAPAGTRAGPQVRWAEEVARRPFARTMCLPTPLLRPVARPARTCGCV